MSDLPEGPVVALVGGLALLAILLAILVAALVGGALSGWDMTGVTWR